VRLKGLHWVDVLGQGVWQREARISFLAHITSTNMGVQNCFACVRRTFRVQVLLQRLAVTRPKAGAETGRNQSKMSSTSAIPQALPLNTIRHSLPTSRRLCRHSAQRVSSDNPGLVVLMGARELLDGRLAGKVDCAFFRRYSNNLLFLRVRIF